MMATAQCQDLLLVDDERDILDAVAMFLESELEGVNIHIAPDATKALDMVEDSHICLVISDFRMPGMDGLQFLVEVHHRHPTIPTIMMTAYPDAELERHARQDAGVQYFLSKPPDLDALLDAVRSSLASAPAGA